MKQFFYILAFIFLLNAPSVYCMLVSSDDYKRELQKFNTEINRSPATAQDALSSLEKSWEEAKAVFETDTLQDIANALGAQSNQTADTFMNNLLSDLKKRLAAARSSRGSAGPSASASMPARPATPPSRPVATLMPASSFAVRPSAQSASVTPSAVPTPSAPAATVVVRPNLSSITGALPVPASETNAERYKQEINKLNKEIENAFPVPAGAGRDAAQVVEKVWDMLKKMISLINQAAEKIPTNKLSDLMDIVSDTNSDMLTKEILSRWPGMSIPDVATRMLESAQEKIALRMSTRPASPIRPPSPMSPVTPPAPPSASLQQLVLDESEPELNGELSYDTDARTYEKEIGEDLYSASLHSDIAARNDARARYYLEEKVWLNIKKAIYAFSKAVHNVEPASVLQNMPCYEQINQTINQFKKIAQDKGYSVEIPAQTLKVLEGAHQRMQERLRPRAVPGGPSLPSSFSSSMSSSSAAQGSSLVLNATAFVLPPDAARYNFDQYVKELKNSLGIAKMYINIASSGGQSTRQVLQDIAWPELKKAIYFFDAAVKSPVNPLALLDLPDVEEVLNEFKLVATAQKYQAHIPESVAIVLNNAQNIKKTEVQQVVNQQSCFASPAASAAATPAQPVGQEPELKEHFSRLPYLISLQYQEYENNIKKMLAAVAEHIETAKLLSNKKKDFEDAWQKIYEAIHLYNLAKKNVTIDANKLPGLGALIEKTLNEFEKELRAAGYKAVIPVSVKDTLSSIIKLIKEKLPNEDAIKKAFEEELKAKGEDIFSSESFSDLIARHQPVYLAVIKTSSNNYHFFNFSKLIRTWQSNNWKVVDPLNRQQVKQIYVYKYSPSESASFPFSFFKNYTFSTLYLSREDWLDLDTLATYGEGDEKKAEEEATAKALHAEIENIAKQFNEKIKEATFTEPILFEEFKEIIKEARDQRKPLYLAVVLDVNKKAYFYVASSLANAWKDKIAPLMVDGNVVLNAQGQPELPTLHFEGEVHREVRKEGSNDPNEMTNRYEKVAENLLRDPVTRIFPQAIYVFRYEPDSIQEFPFKLEEKYDSALWNPKEGQKKLGHPRAVIEKPVPQPAKNFINKYKN